MNGLLHKCCRRPVEGTIAFSHQGVIIPDGNSIIQSGIRIRQLTYSDGLCNSVLAAIVGGHNECHLIGTRFLVAIGRILVTRGTTITKIPEPVCQGNTIGCVVSSSNKASSFRHTSSAENLQSVPDSRAHPARRCCCILYQWLR